MSSADKSLASSLLKNNVVYYGAGAIGAILLVVCVLFRSRLRACLLGSRNEGDVLSITQVADHSGTGLVRMRIHIAKDMISVSDDADDAYLSGSEDVDEDDVAIEIEDEVDEEYEEYLRQKHRRQNSAARGNRRPAQTRSFSYASI